MAVSHIQLTKNTVIRSISHRCSSYRYCNFYRNSFYIPNILSAYLMFLITRKYETRNCMVLYLNDENKRVEI